MKSTFLSRNGTAASSRSSEQGNKPFIGVQAKLSVGKPGDKYEREADQIADQVVQKSESSKAQPSFFGNSPSNAFIQPKVNLSKKEDSEQEIQQKEEDNTVQEKPLESKISQLTSPPDDIQTSTEDDSIQAKCDTCEAEDHTETPVQTKCSECEALNQEKTSIQTKCEKCAQEERVQRKSHDSKGKHGGNNLEQTLHSSKGKGSPMSEQTHSEMSSAFGADMSGVRIHTDSTAIQMNRDLGARAFTNGNDVYFNQGEYNPESKSGKHLLAHELTHTIQQGNNPASIQKADDPCAEPEESGSESEAASNETAPAGDGCSQSNPPVEQPSEDQPEPEGEDEARDIESQEGSPVDERQTHAPAADENAPESEEGIQDDAEQSTEGAILDPCALREQQTGAAAEGGAAEAGANAQATEQPEGETEDKDQAKKGEGEEGDFLTAAAQKGVSPLINPAGDGEQASPEVLAEVQNNRLASEEQLTKAAETKLALNELIATPTAYAPDEQNLEATASMNAATSSFLNGGVTKAMSLLDSGLMAAQDIRGTVQSHRRNLEADISTKRKRTKAFFTSARAQANAKALQAKAQLNVKHILSVIQIEMNAMMANTVAQETYQAKLLELETAHTTELDKLNQSYTTGHDTLIQTGNRMGGAAKTVGKTHADKYRSKAEYKYEGFWDGYVTYNRQMARVDAAKEVGKQYEEGMKSQAKAQAESMMCGKEKDKEFMGAIFQKGNETLECAFLNSQDAIQKHKDAAIMQATYALQELTKNVDNSLTATINQLDEKEAIQLQLLNDYGIRQALAIEKDGETAIASALTGINQAVEQLLAFLKEYQSTVNGSNAPDLETFFVTQEKVQSDFAIATEQTQIAIDTTIFSAKQAIDNGAQTVKIALKALYQQGISDGRELMTSYNTSVDGLVSAGVTAYDEITLNATTSISQEQENAVSILTGIVTAISGLMSDITSAADSKFTEANTNMETGMQTTIDTELAGKICAEAEKAAADVSPWWVSALKVLLIIVVIVVVALVIGPAVIGAVGAAASALAGSLGAGAALAGTIGAWAGPIIGGAIVGAFAGATIQVGNNLIDIATSDKELSWDNVTKGVKEAIIAGAIGGALGGLGGQFAQVLLGRFGGALSQGWKFAADFGINAAFDLVGGVLGDLAAGNPITLEGILLGMAIGGAVQVSMGGLGALAKNSVNAPRVDADGAAVPRTGARAKVEDFAAKIQDFQGRMMEGGQNFGNRAGFGKNAPTADGTRQGIIDANTRMQDGEFFPTKPTEASNSQTRTNSSGNETTSKAQDDLRQNLPEGNNDPVVNPKDFGEGIVERIELPSGRTLRLTEDGLIIKCASPCHIFQFEVEVMARFIDDISPTSGGGAKLRKWLTDLEAIEPPMNRLIRADEFMEALTRIRYIEQMEGIVPDQMLSDIVNASFIKSTTLDDFIAASRAFQASDLDSSIWYSGEFLARNKSIKGSPMEIINQADLTGNPRPGEIAIHSNGNNYEVVGPRTMLEGKNSLLQDLIHTFSSSQRLKENVNRQVGTGDIVEADPFPFGNTIGGHAASKHNASNAQIVGVLNSPDAVFTGFSKTYRAVDVYFKNGRVVVTERGIKTEIITSYTTGVDKLYLNPNLVEITHYSR